MRGQISYVKKNEQDEEVGNNTDLTIEVREVIDVCQYILWDVSVFL